MSRKKVELLELDALRDLLLLVSSDVPERVIAVWSDDQRRAAQMWAWKTHLRASDNIVRVPPMPEFLHFYRDNLTDEQAFPLMKRAGA